MFIVLSSKRERLLSLSIEKNLSVDEQMVSFEESLNVKQYVKIEILIKIFALLDQMFNFIIYQGSMTEFDPAMLKTFGLNNTEISKKNR